MKSTSKKTARGHALVLGTGNGHGRARRIQHFGRRGVDLVQRDAVEQRRQPLIEVQTEAVLLGRLQERGDALVGFEQPRNRTDQVGAGFRSSVAVGPSAASAATS